MKLKNILLLEDDRINAMAFKRGFSQLKKEENLIVKETAELALDYLQDCVQDSIIIVLDLNLPGMSGKEFLARIKQNEKLKKIPVIVLTTSTNPIDKAECFDLQAAGYFKKPIDYFELIRSVYFYWGRSEFPQPQKAVNI